MKNIKLLAIGGCHIQGYGLQNPEDNFVDLIISSTGSDKVQFEKKKIGPVALKKFFQQSTEIDAFSPDILLLQLGNYEFTIDFSKKIRSFLNFKKKKKSDASTPDKSSYIGMINVSRSSYFKIQISGFLKMVGDKLFSFTKTNLAQREIEMKQLIALLEQMNCHVIFLSPLPALDKFTQKSRLLAANFLNNYEIKNKKIKYVDVTTLVPMDRRYFQDGAHLNTEGQRLLANDLQSIFNELTIRTSSQKTVAQC